MKTAAIDALYVAKVEAKAESEQKRRSAESSVCVKSEPAERIQDQPAEKEDGS